MNNIKAKAGISAVVISSVAIIYHFFFVSVNYSGVYGNKVSTWLSTETGRQGEVSWLTKNKINSIDLYGVDGSYLNSVSNQNNVKLFALSFRRSGGQEMGFVISNISSLTYLDKYQKTATDSTRFNVVVTEIEQYQSGANRIAFYDNIRGADKYCHSNNMRLFVYQGWPNQADCDSIAIHADGVYLHAYGAYDKQTNLGAWLYGYSSSRIAMFALSYKKIGKISQNKLLVSWETPDQTKTQFGYKWATTHAAFNDIFPIFYSYYSSHANADMSKYFPYIGVQHFVEDQMKTEKP